MINYIEVLKEDERSRAIDYFDENIELFKDSKFITSILRSHKNNSKLNINLKRRALIEYWLNMMLDDERIQKNIKKRAYNFLSKIN